MDRAFVFLLIPMVGYFVVRSAEMWASVKTNIQRRAYFTSMNEVWYIHIYIYNFNSQMLPIHVNWSALYSHSLLNKYQLYH